jgi:hypothetical protein
VFPSDRIEPANLTFVCCIEGTEIEAQALRLSESIRRFAGTYSNASIVAVNPRADFPIAPLTERRLAHLGVQYVHEPLNRTGSPYLTINRIVTGSWAEAQLASEYTVLLDSDMLFVSEPTFREADVGVRPVDTKGSASAGPDDPLDAYWQALCEIARLSIDSLPFLTASVDGSVIRASYNGGFCVTRRALGILRETHRVFANSHVRDLRPLRGSGLSVFASTGPVGTESSEWWGSSQAALSAAIHARTSDVTIYSDRYNVPVHFFAGDCENGITWPSSDPVLVHYHWLLGADFRAECMRRLRVLGVREDVIAWLRTEELGAAFAAPSADADAEH